jgi:hypothetical protein
MKGLMRLVILFSAVLMLAGVSLAGVGPIVDVDIKPQSCPNPFNFESKGVLSVAILGTTDFDVNLIDPASILLEGVPPLRWSLEDVASAYADSNVVPLCPCNEEGPDGFLDLTLKFRTQDVAVAIGDSLDSGEAIPLQITGNLIDGIPLEGTDCVVVVGSQDNGVAGIEVIVERVTLCHRGMKTLSIGAGGIPAHLRHGDTLGPCPAE